MDENESTVAPEVQAAPVEGQPAAEPSDVTPVDTASAEPSEPSQDVSAEGQDAPDVDDKLRKFAQSQGIELDSPNAIKAAQALQKARSEATRNYQKANELEKATNITQEQLPDDITPQQAENVRIRNLEMKLEIQSWKNQNQDKLALEGEMVKILGDPIKRQMVQEGFLSLDDVYKLAKADAPDNSAEVRTQVQRETLSNLAQKQQASVPTGHATNPAALPAQKDFKDLSIEEMEKRLGYAKRG